MMDVNVTNALKQQLLFEHFINVIHHSFITVAVNNITLFFIDFDHTHTLLTLHVTYTPVLHNIIY